MWWRRLQTLIVKELQALLRDPNGRRLLIMPVILQTLLFPFAATLDLQNARVAVLNQDGGAASIEIVNRIAASPAFTDLRLLRSYAEVRETVDNQRALLVLRFATDFSRSVESGRPAEIQAIIDGRRANSAQIAAGYVQQIAATYQADRQGGGAPTRVVVRNWYNPNLESQWGIIPSLVAIITTVGALITTALSVAREREQGTLDQLLVSPLTPGIIMAGKTIPALMISTVQATLILLIAIFIYRVPFTGSVPLLYLGILAYGLALSGFGLFISSLAATQQQAFLGVFTFMLPAVLLSGFISPIENMPVVLQWISWADPLRHFIVVVKGLFLKEFGVAQVFAGLWPLLAIAIVTMSGAFFMFRKGTA